ncbi:hypothetical protein L1987_46979 [Smallanthus sonchifolius]|uniref:Uncharacterized protein n=1 Tax=Smallanthus sonchifolius TaxID=185202 RepID=A0ACB9G2B7_9ASTR|nr:hypothetical protein L1987_46979 [Smallanthus sonchifolius]
MARGFICLDHERARRKRERRTMAKSDVACLKLKNLVSLSSSNHQVIKALKMLALKTDWNLHWQRKAPE